MTSKFVGVIKCLEDSLWGSKYRHAIATIIPPKTTPSLPLTPSPHKYNSGLSKFSGYWNKGY